MMTGERETRDDDDDRDSFLFPISFAFISLTAGLMADGDAVAFGPLIIDDSGLVYSVVFGLWSLDGAGAVI